MMTRAQMKRAADLLMWWQRNGLLPNCSGRMWFEICGHNPRWSMVREHHGAYDFDESNHIEASILLSEAHRPAGHDGDGTDELPEEA